MGWRLRLGRASRRSAQARPERLTHSAHPMPRHHDGVPDRPSQAAHLTCC